MHKLGQIVKEVYEKFKNNQLIHWAIGIIIIYGVVEMAIFMLFKDWGTRGTFGDSFGAVNALFSGLAFAGLIYTIYLQREELGLQRDELKMTRIELEGQKQEFHIQNETLKIQRFENTFFQLLTLHHQIVAGINYIEKYDKKIEKLSQDRNSHSIFGKPNEETIEQSERIIHGRAVFELRYGGLVHKLKKITEVNEINSQYFESYRYFQNDAGHYFRNLYRIIKFIDQSNLTFDEKYSYISIIRAQLSDYELLWLFYNCLCENGVEKFKPLIEKYSIFKNLNKNYLANTEHRKLYQGNAYKRTEINN